MDEDRKIVLHGGPWTFKKMLLLLAVVQDNGIPQHIPLQRQTFWVQAFVIPLVFMTMEMGKVIGQSLVSLVKVDQNRNGDCLGDFFRIKVEIDVFQPLRRVLKVCLPTGDGVAVALLYERLPAYCFLCGCFDHTSLG